MVRQMCVRRGVGVGKHPNNKERSMWLTGGYSLLVGVNLAVPSTHATCRCHNLMQDQEPMSSNNDTGSQERRTSRRVSEKGAPLCFRCAGTAPFVCPRTLRSIGPCC